jgi:hypothetical protein
MRLGVGQIDPRTRLDATSRPQASVVTAVTRAAGTCLAGRLRALSVLVPSLECTCLRNSRLARHVTW